ncbi:MAG: SDR family oxidoreductase [Acidobacteriaceae bacterium]
MQGNTILITGGGSGIGRGLAEALHREGNQVVIAGRRRGLLEETAQANPGMRFLPLDVEDGEAIREFAALVTAEFPKLNVLINNAGIMRMEKLLEQPEDLGDAEAMVRTNLLGPIRLTAALLPVLKRQERAAILNVTSGLAFVPLALTPVYSATKAALHSYTCSLRYQLKDTAIEVLEVVPPYVQTDLMNGADDPRAMPLKDYIAEAMELLKAEPTPAEICVKNAQGLRFAESRGRFEATFKGLNDAFAES